MGPKQIRQQKNRLQIWMNSSLKRRLVILFLLFAVIPSMVITILSYSRASQTIVDDKVIRAQQDMQLFIRLFELRLRDFESISEGVVFQPEFKTDDFDSLSGSEQLYRINQIENHILKQMNKDQMIDSIYLIGDDFNVVPSIVRNHTVFFEEDQRSYKKLTDTIGGDWVYRSGNDQYLTYRQLVYDKVTFKTIGLCVLNVKREAIDLIYEDILGAYVEEIVVLDQEGRIHYSYGRNDGALTLPMLRDKKSDQELLDGLYLQEDYIMLVEGNDTQFSFMIKVPVDYLYKESRALLMNISVILIIVIILAVSVALNSSKQFIRPIHRMVDTITQNRSGDLSQKIPIEYDNEIGFLSSNYNAMVEETDQLIRNLDRQYYEKRKAELDALQSQITPHFLYNTLNSIRCLARINKETSIETALTSTIELLQLTISNKEVLIAIEDELAIVKNYLKLYAFRMNYDMDTDYNVDPKLLQYRTVKFTLQPFVENAIHHGVDVQSDDARISINIHRSGDDILFEVEDNGAGMTDQQIEDILSGKRAQYQSKFNGIGVKNVVERIRLHYGEGYGVSYHSEKGKGTKVSIRIPMLAEGEQND